MSINVHPSLCSPAMLQHRSLFCTVTEPLVTSSQVFRRRQWHPTPVLLPGKSHGQRSLVGCSPRGSWGSDMTERLFFHFSLSCIGEGNGNPLQCSCLENPRDGEPDGLPAVCGVTQSRTRLKRLSSNSAQVFTEHLKTKCSLVSLLTK